MSGLSGDRAMLELAERCEKATADEHGYFLTYAFELINGRHPPRIHGGSAEMTAYLALRNPFTDKLGAKAYLDAALTLVPEGWLPLLDATDATEGRNYAELFDASDAPIPKACASSLAFALVAAALRARAADTPSVKP